MASEPRKDFLYILRSSQMRSFKGREERIFRARAWRTEGSDEGGEEGRDREVGERGMVGGWLE